jgi:hypothetical protein
MLDAVQTCPGLTCSERGMLWTNSLGQEFDLSAQPKHVPGEVAIKMRRSTEWVLRKIRAAELYPVVYHNPRFVEVYDCAIADYYHRHTQGGGTHAAA